MAGVAGVVARVRVTRRLEECIANINSINNYVDS